MVILVKKKKKLRNKSEKKNVCVEVEKLYFFGEIGRTDRMTVISCRSGNFVPQYRGIVSRPVRAIILTTGKKIWLNSLSCKNENKNLSVNLTLENSLLAETKRENIFFSNFCDSRFFFFLGISSASIIEKSNRLIKIFETCNLIFRSVNKFGCLL